MRPARRTSHPFRRVATYSAMALVLVLTGCGGDGDSGDTEESSSPLSQEQADTALLTEGNLGEGFVVAPEEGDDSEGIGCLAFLADLGESEDAATTAEIDYEFENDMGNPAVLSIVESYDDTDGAEGVVDALRGELEDCDAVDHEDEDGLVFSLDVSSDDEWTADGTDDQLNLSAEGTISSGEIELPFSLELSVAQVGQHLTIVGVTDLGSHSPEAVDAYTQTAVDRLVAVVDGDEPSDTTAPAPTPTG